MAKILLILCVGFMFEAMGVIALKKGIDGVVIQYTARKDTTPMIRNCVKMVGEAFSTKEVWLGLALETGFFLCLIYLLGQRDVSFIWPLTALSFITTTLAARFLLHETVSPVRWWGVVFIVIGAGFISYSEHVKDSKAADAVAKTASPATPNP